MKTRTVVIAALFLGALLGVALAYLHVGDPGDDLTRLEPLPYATVSEPEGVTGPSNPSVVDTPSSSALPIEVVGGEEFDFGVMDQGETRSHAFVFRNHSDKAVTLEVKETTCKCTVGELADDTIPPGSEVNVKLEWKPVMFEPEFRQTATIATSCPDRLQIVLSIFGRVIQSLTATPRNIAFSDVSFRANRETDLLMHAFKDADFEITDHTWSDPDISDHFEFVTREVTASQREAEPDAVAAVAGVVKLKSGLPLGPFRQVLQLNTNVERFGLLEIPIWGRIIGDISLSGTRFIESQNRLRLGPIAQSKGASAKIRVTVKGPHAKDFEVTGVRVEPDLLDGILEVKVVETRSLRDGVVTLVTLEVEVPPGSRPVNFMGGKEHEIGKAVLQTSHPELAEVPFEVEFAITE